MKKPLLGLLVALGAAPLLAASIVDSATYTIYPGWNAIYLPVTPLETADTIFADWPVSEVGFYDQAAFLRTKQFTDSADDSTLGAVDNGMEIWKRDDAGASGFDTLIANGIYVFKATNTVNMTRTVKGIPEAMRVSWHVATSTNAPLNYVGVSVGTGHEATLTEKGYFQGLDTGWTYAKGVLRDPTGNGTTPTLDIFYGGKPTKENLGVVAMDAAKVSDWSGPLYVSPSTGLDLGTNLWQGALTVRNDAGTNRLVRVTLRVGMSSETGLAVKTPGKLLRYCDTAVSNTADYPSEAWITSLEDYPFEKELLAGETLTLKLAIDRTQEAAAGLYGGILDVTDVSTVGPTLFHTAVPFSVTIGEVATTTWPDGLWLADLALGTVEGLKAGSTMNARVLVHVAHDGTMNLMQRAKVGTRRISSVVLPAEKTAYILPGTGTFGTSARFDWTVDEHSRVNPFRHALHPDHDGLRMDFTTPAPSGDNFDNYVSTVKPELFSVTNRLALAWTAHAGTAWNPEETLSGTCTWRLTGLRHDNNDHKGPIDISGTFTMKRISTKTLKEIKEDL